MPFPDGWPPRPASGRRSLRAFVKGTTTPNFADNAYLFGDLPGAKTIEPTPYVAPGSRVQTPIGSFNRTTSPQGGGRNPNDAVFNQHISPPYGDEAPPVAMFWAGTIRVMCAGGTGEDLQVTYDGTNIQGEVLGGEELSYRNRFEAGIAVRIAGDAATGSITTVAVANLIDGETVVLDDGANPAVTFEFDDNDSVVESNVLRQVDISGITTADEVRDALIAAINSAPVMGIVASDGGAATVSLQGGTGTAANVAVTETVADGGFAVTGMAGGTGTASAFRIEAW